MENFKSSMLAAAIGQVPKEIMLATAAKLLARMTRAREAVVFNLEMLSEQYRIFSDLSDSAGVHRPGMPELRAITDFVYDVIRNNEAISADDFEARTRSFLEQTQKLKEIVKKSEAELEALITNGCKHNCECADPKEEPTAAPPPKGGKTDTGEDWLSVWTQD